MTGLWLVSYLALWGVVLVVAVALLSILRNLSVIYDSLAMARTPSTQRTKLVAGESLPELTLQTLTGVSAPLADFRGTKTAISIVSPQCSPCHDLLRSIIDHDEDPDPVDPTVRRRIVVSVGDAVGTSALVEGIGFPRSLPVLIDSDNSIAREWGVTATPTTVIVDDHLRVVRQIFGISSSDVAA